MPALELVRGDGMSADDAAWAMVADAAERALTLPDLSPEGALRMTSLRSASLRAARLPEPPRPAAGQEAPTVPAALAENVTAKERALHRAAATVTWTNLLAAGDRLLGRGVTAEWERAKADAIDRLDEAEALGATTDELDAIVREN